MNTKEFKSLVKDVIRESAKLKDKHTEESVASVNYVALFCQNEKEYKEFLGLAGELGKVYKDTTTGPIFLINLDTKQGKLKLLKVREPDETRRERGDADFTVGNYNAFKEKYLSKPGFSLIKRESFEMIELIDPDFNVRTYFSNPTLEKQFEL